MLGNKMIDLIQWIEVHPGTAAWVQAIGSILAIIGAFAIAFWEFKAIRRVTDRERRMRAQGLALLLHSELLAFKAELEDRDPVQRLLGRQLEPPETIVRQADQLYLLGTAGGAILQMLSILNANRRMGPAPMLANTKAWDKFFELQFERMRIALANCEEAITGLQAIIDSKV